MEAYALWWWWGGEDAGVGKGVSGGSMWFVV